MARRTTKARICLAGTLAAYIVSGLATGIGDASAAVTRVQKKRNFNFGDVAGDADLGGTVVISPAGAKTVTGGASDLGGVHTSAQYKVKGDVGTVFTITLPGSITLTAGGNTATVNAFTSSPSGTGTIPSAGEILVDIGATLVLSAGQAAGNYSGSFDGFFDGITDDKKVIPVDATVAAAISVSTSGNLEFGTVSPTGTAGTVTVTPAGVRTSVDVDLVGGLPSAASFDVTGAAGQAYSITLPSSTTLTSGANTMTVDTYTDDAGATPTLVGGSDTFNVGATLNVGAPQADGTYSGTFPVTVGYN